MASTGDALGSARNQDGITAEEAELARRAADGDGQAFATLYDRYEGRIYNFCNRLLASPDDAADATQEAFLKVLQRLPKLEGRELNFSAYLFTAARNSSYDMIGRRKRATPVDEVPDRGGGEGARDPGDLYLDPERTAMLAAGQEEVRVANGRLPERQREVLALFELEEKTYDEIAEIMGLKRNAVAQLISRARIKLRDELRGTALATVAVATPDCERALPLIAARSDGQLAEGEDRDWVERHLVGCETCRVAEEAMEDAGRSYRAWLPLVPLLWLRRETIAKAGELVGSDWTHVAHDRPMDGSPSAGNGGVGGQGAGGSGAAGVGAGAGAGLAHGRLRNVVRGRRRGLFALLGALALLVGVFVAIVVGDDGTPSAPADSTLPAATSAADPTAGGGEAATTTAAKPKGKKKKAATTTGAAAAQTTTTATLPSGKTVVKTVPRKHARRSPRRADQGGSRQGGSGGPVNVPSTPTTTAEAPPTTTAIPSPPPPTASNPPPVTTTTTQQRPCRPGAVPCPR